jgi:hypothetical protein
MKIYTEINYEFKNGELIEIDSKSIDYTGEVTMCNGGGPTPAQLMQEAKDKYFASLPVDIPDPLEEAGEAGLEIAEAYNPQLEPQPEPEPDPEFASSTGTGSLQGQMAALQINKKTQGAPGAFTRGSLRVRKPRPIVV